VKDRRLATILAIDVAGYSRMMQADAAELLAALNTIFHRVVKPRVAEHGGRVVKLLGDGALVEFPSAFSAIACATAIQTDLRGTPPPYSYREPIALRMGLHAGDVLAEGGDIFGDGVNIAARLQAAAEPGNILLSRTVADLAGGEVAQQLRREGVHRLKNIAAPVETLSVVFGDTAAQIDREKLARVQEIRFCTASDGLRLAWTEVGSGPSLVKAPNWIGHLELDWRAPGLGHIFASIAARCRLVRFDARGNGLSDWEMENISFDLFVDDLRCVFDAAGIERAPILAISQGCAVAVGFAARFPEHVSGIVMIGGYPVGRAKRASAKDKERAKALKAMMAAGWDDDYPSLRDLMAEIIVPSASVEDRRQYAEDMRQIISPENLARYRDVVDHLNVTGMLAQVQAPCLVMHCRGDRMQPIEQGRKLAAGLPNARFIALDSNSHEPTENEPGWPVMEREMHAFLEAFN
jgi:class 3 adenylate cyclase/pimeloyl-ACP methyl ester carboxylesterase